MYIFNPLATIKKTNEGVVIYSNNKEITIKIDVVEVKKWILNLPNNVNIEEIKSFISSDELNQLLHTLLKEQVIKLNVKNKFNNTAYEKQVLFFNVKSDYPNEIQESIFNKNVLILGVGGIGSIVLQNLVALGVHNYYLVDYDDIDISNLNRQVFFDYTDIGKNKLEITKNKLLKINPKLNITTINKKVSSQNDIINIINNKIDCIICAADTPIIEIKQISVLLSLHYDCAVCFASVGYDIGHWGPFLINTLDKKNYLTQLENLKLNLSNNIKTIPMSIGYTNAIIGNFLSMDIVNYFINEPIHSLNKNIAFHFNKLKFTIKNIDNFIGE